GERGAELVDGGAAVRLRAGDADHAVTGDALLDLDHAPATGMLRVERHRVAGGVDERALLDGDAGDRVRAGVDAGGGRHSGQSGVERDLTPVGVDRRALLRGGAGDPDQAAA